MFQGSYVNSICALAQCIQLFRFLHWDMFFSERMEGFRTITYLDFCGVFLSLTFAGFFRSFYGPLLAVITVGLKTAGLGD